MRVLRVSVVLALSALYLSFVFQLQSGAPRQSGLGDWLDPYFINYLLEHWYHSLLTLSDPTSPAMYFPTRRTLGYSHGLILYMPFYAAVRPFLHPFQAYTASLFLMMTTGCLFLYGVLRTFVRLRFVEALLFTAFFATSPNIVNSSAGFWSQRASVFLIRVILFASLAAWRQSGRTSRVMPAWVPGLLPPLLFTQHFSTGQFALFLILCLAGVVIADRGPVLTAQTATRPSRWWLGLAGVSLALAAEVAIHPVHRIHIAGARIGAANAVPLLLVALLAAGWFAARRWQMVALVEGTWHNVRQRISARASWPGDGPYVVAVTAGAVMGSVLFLWIYLPTYRAFPGFPDWMVTGALTRSAFPYAAIRPFVLVLMIAALARVPRLHVDRHSRVMSLWFLGVSAVVIAIPQQIGAFSIWKAFFMPLPGFAAIRNPDRIIEVYETASVLAVGLFLARQPDASFLRRAIPAAVVLLMLADWTPATFVFKRPNRAFEQMVEAPIAIDSSCRSFFILGASEQYVTRQPCGPMLPRRPGSSRSTMRCRR